MRISGGILLFLMTVSIAYGTASGQESERKPSLPHFGAVKFIDADQYEPSEEFDLIFSPALWREITGVWVLNVTSSGIHNYYEIEFVNSSDYIIKSGIRRRVGAGTGDDHREETGAYYFDKESKLLYMCGEKCETYSVDYFRAKPGEEVRFNEILTLTPTGRTQPRVVPSNTFVR